MDLRHFDRTDWTSFYIPESASLKSSIQKILLDFCFRPLLLQYSDYKWSDFSLDLMASITNVCTLLPSSISYAATLAFASNRAGLTSCFIPPIIYSLFGTSRHLSIGPSVLSSIITGSITQQLMVDTNLSNLSVHKNLSFYTGLVCIGLSFFQAGFLDNVISGYLLSGFISCVAILLITNQIPTILGLPIDLIIDEPIYMKLTHIFNNIQQLNLPSTALGISSLIFLFLSFYLVNYLSKNGSPWIHRIPIIFVLLLLTSLLSYGVDFHKYVL
jgi:MFS superfamily sulfate permease-like transporter